MNSTVSRNRFSGKTDIQTIADYVADIGDMGIRVDDVVDDGSDGFNLYGEALIDYVRRALRALIDAGARPTRGNEGGPKHCWDISTLYGTEPDDIIENVIATWQALGRPLEWGEIHFATPETCAEYREFMRLDKL